MNVLFDRVDWGSTAGPHWFARKLAQTLQEKGHGINTDSPDVQLSIVIATQKHQGVPLIQRLSGVYYDVDKNYEELNAPIRHTYNNTDGVIFISNFTKNLIESFFGSLENSAIIHNGADVKAIQNTIPATGLESFDKVWSCASSWFYEDGSPRSIKRLHENIRYFQEHSGDNDILCVAGNPGRTENPDPMKILFLGDLDIPSLYSVYRASDYFIHLAKLDASPNVVADARAAGCHIICSSLGGTVEIAGKNSTVILEEDWDYKPYRSNLESKLDFSRVQNFNTYDNDISMDHVADNYLNFMEKMRSLG